MPDILRCNWSEGGDVHVGGVPATVICGPQSRVSGPAADTREPPDRKQRRRTHHFPYDPRDA